MLQRRRLLAAAAGLAVGLLLNIAFNGLRFQAAYNPLYMEEAQLGPDLPTHRWAFWGLWISPGGGWLFFWPLFVGFLVAVPVALRRHGPPASGWTYAPFWGALGILVLLTTFLSGWWAPFGWWAWGQRLMLPWLPALLLVLAYAYAAELEALLRVLLSTPRKATLWVVLMVLLSLPHVASVFRSAELMKAAFGRDRSCDGPRDPNYYRCLRTVTWENASPLWLAYEFVPGPLARGRMLLWIPLLTLLGRGLYAATRPASFPAEGKAQ